MKKITENIYLKNKLLEFSNWNIIGLSKWNVGKLSEMIDNTVYIPCIFLSKSEAVWGYAIQVSCQDKKK